MRKKRSILKLTLIVVTAVFMSVNIQADSLLNMVSSIVTLSCNTDYVNRSADSGGSGGSGGADVQDDDTALHTVNYIRPTAGGKEMRGVWIASVININFPSKTGLTAAQQKAELDAIVKTTKEAGLNAIFFQVRPTADALYDSGIFPTSQYLTGRQGDPFVSGFDPLKYIVEKAHENNIELHAWINPYRITMGSASAPQHDVTALAANHPARLHPEYTVAYADGKLYFNPALPEVRDLITRGITEIVSNYDVDGIHFDDYFYPSPISGAKFNDDAEYEKYGAKFSNIADFRRDCVNLLVKGVYEAIKRIDPDCRFGISPPGIWANSGTEGGSKTTGYEAYHSSYADATAWIKGNYIDYICPQIYWAFTTKAAQFDIVTRWWSTLCDGSGVDLYIGHAAYRVSGDFKNSVEIPRQVEFARNYISVKGSIFYGYADIAANSYSLKQSLAELYKEELIVSDPVSTGSGITVGKPANGATIAGGSVYIMAGSDPAYPVYYNNRKVTRTKSGYFSVFINLAGGKNTINFTQNGKTTSHTINNGATAANTANISNPDITAKKYVYPQMDSYKIEVLQPVNNYIVSPGAKITVRVQAPSNSAVTATLGGISVKLAPLTNPPDEGKYMTETYSGTITLPDTQPDGKLIELGDIRYDASRGTEKASLTGVDVKLINNTVNAAAEVVKDYAHQKIAADSSFYDDYLPASVGMRDYIVSLQDGYYKLRFGAYVAESNMKLIPERSLLENKILTASMEKQEKITQLKIGVTENVPVTGYAKDGVFFITLFNTPVDFIAQMAYADNPIFKDVKTTYNETKRTVTYTFNLKNPDNFYGFDVVYENGTIYVNVKNPIRKTEGNKPLAGLNIIVDAGHGGSDPGALGYLGTKGKNEKDFNLDIALELEKKLKELGATVYMIRTTDATVDIYSRMDTLIERNPDLCISVHHNSVGDSSDGSLVRGLETRYCNESGRLLAKAVSNVVSDELNRYERDTKYQMLAMLRNHRFPAALIEMLFLTNPEEYETAMNSKTPARSANAIANGIIEWLDRQQQFIS